MDSQLAALIQRLARPCVMPMRKTESQHLATLRSEAITCGPYRSRVLIKDHPDPQAKSALLLHGWGGHPMMLAPTQMLLHAQGYRVYMPFLLGHDPDARNSCDMPGQCALLLAMQASYGPFDSVVAHSAGGIITSMAHWSGFTLNQVALLSAPASLSSLLQHSLAQLRAPEHYLPLLNAHYQSRYPLPAALHAAHPYTFSGARVLVMHGTQDQRVNPADARQIHGELPDSHLHMIEGTGHLGILPHQCTHQVLARFLCAQNADHEKGITHAGAY